MIQVCLNVKIYHQRRMRPEQQQKMIKLLDFNMRLYSNAVLQAHAKKLMMLGNICRFRRHLLLCPSALHALFTCDFFRFTFRSA